MTNITIYADGSCIGNPGPGGWGYAIISNGDIIHQESGCSKCETTNNRMELKGATEALRWVADNFSNKPLNIILTLDSQYVLNGLKDWMPGWKNKGWKKVKNVELWKKLDKIKTKLEEDNVFFHYQWVKGHANDEINNLVDKLANDAAQQQSGHYIADVDDRLKKAAGFIQTIQNETVTPEDFLKFIESNF